MVTYTPQPIDTSGVEIPDELDPLVERIAEHLHDLWAVARISEGVEYGPQRTEATNPCLLPYGDLPHGEREYDRANARETVKVLVGLGWSLTPPGDAS